jgi:signal transduction histidine kinase
VFQNISTIRQLEQQRDRVLGIVAHDLRNPLTSIAGMSQLLQVRAGRLDASIGERFVQGLQSIEAAARSMTAQIGELLDYAQAQTGNTIGLAIEATDVVALVERVVREHQQSTDGHTLEVRAAEAAIVAQVDARRLERAIVNLVVNAIKYSPKGGPIVVTVARVVTPEGLRLCIEVVDRGLGIPATDLPHLFEQYYRASNVASTIPGTGIGLVSVRHTVERHGGMVTIDSAVGEGTTVTVHLPLVQDASILAEPPGS